MLRYLPKYVAYGPGAMPSMQLYEGDLAVIMRMDGQIGELGSQMAAILEQVQSLQWSTTAGVMRKGPEASATSCIVNTRGVRVDHFSYPYPYPTRAENFYQYPTRPAGIPVNTRSLPVRLPYNKR